MKYRNTKTQAVIETACELRGGDWVKDDAEQPKAQSQSVAKKTKPKKSGD